MSRLPACIGLLLPAVAAPQDLPTFDVGGLVFGDLYHVPNNHLPAADGATGVVVRRGYLTFDSQFSKRWKGRLRFELNQSGEFEAYDFEIDVKDLHVAGELGRHEVILGLSPTPTFALIEDVWDLRYLARTPMDMQGVASRDTGIAVGGPLNTSGSINFSVMLGTGIEFGAEAGDGRKLMASLSWQPASNYFLEAYVDGERLAGPRDRVTAQVFAGYNADDLRWGLQYSYQDRQNDPTLELASVFVVRPMSAELAAIGRIDRIMQPSPEGDNISYIPFDPTAPATMFLAGLEFRVSENLRFTPNTIVISYDRNADGNTPPSDVHLRLTFFADFE